MSSAQEQATDHVAVTTAERPQPNMQPLATEMVHREQGITSKAQPQLELNFTALARAGYLTRHTIQGSLAEKYRFLKHSLLSDTNRIISSSTEYRNLIMITSARSGEGKTYTAFNLAMSIATAVDALKVLVVDCDLGGRSLTQLVGLADAPGLTNVLLDSRVSLNEVIFNTNISKLRLIPAGTYPGAIELMAAKQMQDLVHELSARYNDRIILFDSMPLFLNSQALLLASMMGTIIVVVEEGKTLQKDIKEAISLLDQTKSVGLVLNKCSR